MTLRFKLFRSSFSSDSRILELAKGILNGQDRSFLARAITLVESKLPEHAKDAQELFKCLERLGNSKFKNKSLRIGISGSPGVGKSSLIEALGMHCIEQEGMKVATLAIDPSSNKSGGSILGDKTRMSQLAHDPRAFVRPSPSGGQLGGVARGTFLAISLCEYAGYDVIFVESVGVGQSETQLADLTDIFILCAAPMAGDDLQAMKRGISEFAELILLNKAEEPMSQAARKALLELKMSQTLRSHPTQVLPVSAWKGSGMRETWEEIKRLQKKHLESGEFTLRRRNQQLIWLKSFIHGELLERFQRHLDGMESKLQDLKISDSLTISSEIIKELCERELEVIRK